MKENKFNPASNVEDLINVQTYKAIGMKDDDFELPIIGICNTWSEIVPGHYNLRQVADFVKKGIYRGGGNAVEFGTIGCCDGVSSGTAGDYYVLPSREIIADSVEIMAKAHGLDGLVIMGSCDKIVPGLLMGVARINIPAIFIPGGPSLSGPPFATKMKSENTCIPEAIGMLQAGLITREELTQLSNVCDPTCGSCSVLGTANSMCCIAEAIGMSLTGAAAVPAVYTERFRYAFRTGEKIVELVKSGIKTREIMSYPALRNAIKVLMAIGGSTNCIIHLCALAHELGFDPDDIMVEIDKQSEEIPNIAKVNPASNVWDMEDFYLAGGIPQVMINLKDKLDLSVITASGKTMAENLGDYRPAYTANDDLIRSMENPHSKTGGIAIIKGNLAPDTGVAKPAAIADELKQFTGAAMCFDSQEECVQALEERRIKPGQVVVIRYEGPKGGPGMREMFKPLKLLFGQGLLNSTVLITDGRVSGTNNGCFVAHISPEAAAGGPIALIKDGDLIKVDIINKRLDLMIDEKEFERRRKNWHYTPKKLEGYLARYAATALSGNKGCILV